MPLPRSAHLTKRHVSNVVPSVRQRLLTLPDKTVEHLNALLTQFAIERFLSRHSQSSLAHRLDARLEVPRSFLSTLKARFVVSAQIGLGTALLAGRPHRDMGSRHRLWMSIKGSNACDARKIARSLSACTNSPQSVGRPLRVPQAPTGVMHPAACVLRPGIFRSTDRADVSAFDPRVRPRRPHRDSRNRRPARPCRG
jgi:hypothetical protein